MVDAVFLVFYVFLFCFVISYVFVTLDFDCGFDFACGLWCRFYVWQVDGGFWLFGFVFC